MSGSQDSLASLEHRIARLAERGVRIVDPRQTYIGPRVELDRIRPGARLHPGTRLHGARCFVGEGAVIGGEGPAVLMDAAIAEQAEVASGYVEGAVLLRGARAGANAHLRPGTLLEEQASTAHCVGLKHTILLPFVTLGSLINFCDCLMAGGTSRRDHSELGSGFIHFNFTPWGERGDKATPSLIGDVTRGVFLRQPRIFLGGSSGLVGPIAVGYGAVTGAGQVLRRDVEENALILRTAKTIERTFTPGACDRLQPRLDKNLVYIAQLFALRQWYREVRLARLAEDDPRRPPIAAGGAVIELAIAERRKQVQRFVDERGGSMPDLSDAIELPACPWSLGPDEGEHLDWVRSLSEEEVEAGEAWLGGIVRAVLGAKSS